MQEWDNDKLQTMLLACVIQLKDYSENQWVMAEGCKDYHINEIELELGLDERTVFNPDECPEEILAKWKEREVTIG